jgi:hypothetical protein
MSTINFTYNVIVDRFRQFADGHFQLRRFTHGEISQADLEKEAEWPWLHVKPRAINYSAGTRAFSFEVFISDLPRDKEDKTGYQAESITDCSLIFQDLINEIYLGQMFGDQVVLTRPVNSEPFVEQYTHTLTGVTGIIELNLDYDWSACSIPASWNYNTPTNTPNEGFGALQFIESLTQDGAFVSLVNDEETPGNSYYYGTDASGVKGWYAIVDNIGLTCETLPECATIISILEDIEALQIDVALKANSADLGATAFSNDYNDLDNLPTIPSIAGLVPETRTLTINGTTQDLSADRSFSVGTFNLPALTNGSVLFSNGTTIAQDNANLFFDDTNNRLGIGTNTPLGILHLKDVGQTTRFLMDGDAGQSKIITYRTNGLQRFGLYVNNIAESGGNAGSDFAIRAYNDAGVLLSTPLYIKRSSGNVLINTTTDAGYKLDVNGTARVLGTSTMQSILPQTNNTYDIGAIGNYYQIGFIQTIRNNNIRMVSNAGGTSFQDVSANTLMRLFGATGNFLIQNGGTFTDEGYRLDVNGSVRATGSISAASLLARGTFLNQTLVATANNDVLVGLDVASTFTNGAFTGVSNIGLRLLNTASAPAGGVANSPSLILQGSIWNSALGARLMRGGLLITAATYPSAGSNINPTISKMSFLVASENAQPTEQMSLTSNGRLIINGGFVGLAPNTNNIYNLTLDNLSAASVGTTFNSNKLVLKGKVWNSGQGSVNNMAYLMVSNITNNANPTVDKLSIFVGSGFNTNAGDTNGNATERLAIRTDGIFSYFNLSGTEVTRIVGSTGNFLIGTTTDAGYRLDVQGTGRFTGSSVFSSAITVGGASAFSGSMVIGNNTITEASAKLEVRATTQGFLPPRMTNAQRLAIASPAVGLIVYCTDVVEGLYINKSTGWTFVI